MGGYRLRARLGGGGMGTVYLGTSPGGRPVAVKLVRADLADDRAFRARFAREVQLARRVHGFCTAPVVAADPDAPRPWLVTLYIPAPSLVEAVHAAGPLRQPAALILAAGLAEALIEIHDCGVVHRDLKPSNVLLAPDGPRVIDFGIARVLDGSAITATGALIGSPGYMAPEQVLGQEAGPATDVFALAATIGYATTARSLFGTGDPRAMLQRVLVSEPDLSGVPNGLRDLLRWCLAKDPNDRPTAGQLLAELAGPTQAAQTGSSGWFHVATPPAAVLRSADGWDAARHISRTPRPATRSRGGTAQSDAPAYPATRRAVAASRADYRLAPWPRNGAGTASLALGILGVVLFFGPGTMLGLLGLIFGVVGVRRVRRGTASNRRVAVAGMIISIVAILISLSVLNTVGRWAECAWQHPGDLAAQAACRSGGP